jgi:hypothetical protein
MLIKNCDNLFFSRQIDELPNSIIITNDTLTEIIDNLPNYNINSSQKLDVILNNKDDNKLYKIKKMIYGFNYITIKSIETDEERTGTFTNVEMYFTMNGRRIKNIKPIEGNTNIMIC